MKRVTSYLGIIPVFCLPILIAHIYLARWSFPQADDFAFAADAIKYGVFGNVVQGYLHWEGRFSPYFLVDLIGWTSLFPYHTNLLMIISLTFFVLALAAVLWRLNGKYSSMLWVDITFIVLALPHEVKQQTFYWLDGNTEYLLPITITCFVLTFIDHPIHQRFENRVLLSIFLLFILLGGFCPLLPMTLIICIGGYLVSLYPLQQNLLIRRNVAILLGTSVGLLIVIIAPGNYVRLHMINGGHNPNIFSIALRTLNALYSLVPSFLVASLSYGFLRMYLSPSPFLGIGKMSKSSFWCLITAFIAVVAIFYFTIYGLNGIFPPARILLLPFIVIFIAALCLTNWIVQTYSLSHYLGRRFAFCRYILLLLLLVLALHLPAEGFNDMISSLKQGPEQRRAAIAQINAAYLAKKENLTTLTVENIPNDRSMLLFNGITRSQNDWKNHYFAAYFGLQEVVAR